MKKLLCSIVFGLAWKVWLFTGGCDNEAKLI